MPGGWELIVIVGVLLLLFGAKKLPDMARSVGQSARVFKGEMKGMKADDEAREAEREASRPQAPPALPVSGQTPPEQARSTQPDSDTTR
jgi:sec-independent protein translocase protein TatA